MSNPLFLASQTEKLTNLSNVILEMRRVFNVTPKKIIYVGDKTIVLWSDDTKTEVKCVPGEQFSQEGGFAACLVKKMFPNRSQLLRMINEKKEIREPKKRKNYELLDKIS